MLKSFLEDRSYVILCVSVVSAEINQVVFWSHLHSDVSVVIATDICPAKRVGVR